MTSRSRIAKHMALDNDLPYFCANAPLRIKNKVTGELSIFRFNRAQQYVHSEIERMLKEVGLVRVLVVKGRQQGVSTYVSARYVHKASRKKNKKVFILAHEAPATKNLFKMAKNYHNEMDEAGAPDLDESNQRVLIFDNVKSEYQVGTAGAGATGRSTTTDYFHGSEVGFWENTDEIRTGVMQTVSTSPGTEIILESTANGMGGMFYKMCMEAQAGEGLYRLIFVPWFWQDEYRMTPPVSFKLDEDDLKYQETYGLDMSQMYWRHLKIKELEGVGKFRQEYPANVQEAFQSSGNGLIAPESIWAARQRKVKDLDAPLILGVDPARLKDRVGFAFRRGREAPKIYGHDCTKIKMTEVMLADLVGALIEKHNVVKCFIDCGAGYGAYDTLVSRGFGDIVESVLFGSAAIESDIYLNKRAEMWCLMAQWIDRGASIPDDDAVHADLGMMPDKKQMGDNRYKMVSKDDLRADYGRSPDLGDALALTFAAPVRNVKSSTKYQKANNIVRKSNYKSRNR